MATVRSYRSSGAASRVRVLDFVGSRRALITCTKTIPPTSCPDVPHAVTSSVNSSLRLGPARHFFKPHRTSPTEYRTQRPTSMPSPRSPLKIRRSSPSSRVTTDHPLATFVRPLFSHSYKSIFSQTVCFDNHLSCPGVWGALCALAAAAPSFPGISAFALITYIQALRFHQLTRSFAQRHRTKPRALSSLRTLCVVTEVVPLHQSSSLSARSPTAYLGIVYP
jgi:hypothetical protein